MRLGDMEYYRTELGPGWWVLLLGWPAVSGALLAFSLAVARRSRLAAIVGLLLATPMFLYLSATPRFRWAAPAALALLCVLVWRFRECGGLTKFLLALPALAIMIWLAYAVMTQ